MHVLNHKITVQFLFISAILLSLFFPKVQAYLPTGLLISPFPITICIHFPLFIFCLFHRPGRCVGLTTLPHSCADCLEIWGPSTSWNPQGLARSVHGCFTFTFIYSIVLNFYSLKIIRNKRR